jgi:hypothetical protein
VSREQNERSNRKRCECGTRCNQAKKVFATHVGVDAERLR